MRSTTAIAVCLVLAPIHAQGNDALPDLEQRALQRAVDRVAPSLVEIITVGGQERVGQFLVGTGPTTGLVVSENGFIVSSAFNFVQQPSSILVTFSDGRRASAHIEARDHSRMLVLLKASGVDDLVVPAAVPRSSLRVGQWAVAVGKTFNAAPNRSVGILSATNRIWGKAIQTDAKVSPNNYGGPLIDIRGRVLGILVPLSPHGRGEVAGAQWYDSGIGFAIPLADVFDILERWKRDEELHPGIMGISLTGNDIFNLPAQIAACLPNSPARAAGLKADDVIVEIDGQPIEKQVHLKHALGPKYAGQQVRVVATRGEQRFATDVLLTDEVQPYEHPFLGILPRRDEHGKIVVRHVYTESPADEAGIQIDDVMLRIDGRDIRDPAGCWEALAAVESRENVRVEYERQGTVRIATVDLDTLPDNVPVSLPPSKRAAVAHSEQRPAVGLVELKVPEAANEIWAHVPKGYDPRRRYGLVVWLHSPGKPLNREQLVARWKEYCDQRDLIVLVPQPADPRRWQRTEIEFVRKAIDQMIKRYRIDATRIIAHGYQVGGTLAFMLAFAHIDVVRAVVAVDAPLPAATNPPATDPLRRLSVHMTIAKDSTMARRARASAHRLEQLKYPVTIQELPSLPSDMTTDISEETIRWIDALDRI